MKWKVAIKWVLGLGIFALVFVLGDVGSLARLRVTWTYVLGILASTLAFIFVHTVRWKKIVDAVSHAKRLRFVPYWRWMVHSYTLGYIIPRDISLLSVRTYFLTQHEKLSLSASLFSVTLDRFLDMALFLIVVLPSFLFVTKGSSGAQCVALMAVFLAAFLLVIRWKGEETFRLLMGMYKRVLTLPIIRKRVPAPADGARAEDSLGKVRFLPICLWTVLAYLLLVSRLFFTSRSLDVNLTFVQSLFIIPIIQIAGLVSVTPAGLGVLELGSWGALTLLHVPKEQILQFVVGQRILLTAVMLSVIVLNYIFFLITAKAKGDEVG
jgi:glycosyltransferase 2 family protein